MAATTWALRCRCGLELSASSQLQLLVVVNTHLTEKHPVVAGAYDDDTVLSLAYPKPARRNGH